MTPFELEWLRGEKEQHSRLLYQLKRELAEQRKGELSFLTRRLQNVQPQQNHTGHPVTGTKAL